MGSWPPLLAGLALVCAVAFLGVGLRSRLGGGVSSLLDASSGPTADSEKRMCLNKRTLFSTDPYSSGLFLKRRIGLSLDSSDYVDSRSKNFTSIDGETETGCGEDGMACCMDRATLSSAVSSSSSSVAYHMIRSNVTLPSNGWVEGWVDYWNGLHPAMGNLSTWDPFLFASTGFWVPDLSAHTAAAGADGARRSYTGMDGEPMYALVQVDRATGRVWEVHAPHVSASMVPTFSPLADDAGACADAFGPSRTTKAMMKWWAALNATQRATPAALVAPLLFKVSAPVSDAAAANSYFADVWTSLPWGDVDVDSAAACKYLSTEVTIDCESLSTDDAPMVRFVAVEALDAAASALPRTVADYEADVAAMRAATMGLGAGWSRVLDDHVKFDLPNGWALDSLVDTLDATDAEWHAHIQALGMNAEGSIWAAGIGALAIEYGGMFDYTAFTPGSLDEYNWCNASSVCGPADSTYMVCN